MAIVDLGINKSNPRERIVWDTNRLVNGHWIILGASGVGKTHQIRNIVKQLGQQNVRCYVFDAHGDIETLPEMTSEVVFSETSQYGVNPFVVNPSAHFGGIRRKVNSIVRMVTKYSGSLDAKQEAILRNLIKDLYKEFGYDHENPATWVRPDCPTIKDLKNLAFNKLTDFYFGNIGFVSDLLDKFYNHAFNYQRQQLSQVRDRVSIDDTKDELIAEFKEFLEYPDSSSVEAVIKYESKQALKSVYDRIDNIEGLGVFKPHSPDFDMDMPVWRYNMSALSVEEQGYLVELSLEKIFIDSIERGFNHECNKVIFIDEAQRFIDAANEDHIISIISREARKFGIGMALASQSFNAFPDSIILNSGTRFLLGVDECFHDFLSKSLGVDTNKIRFIQPRKSALIQIKTQDMSTNSRFHDLLLASDGVSDETVPSVPTYQRGNIKHDNLKRLTEISMAGR